MTTLNNFSNGLIRQLEVLADDSNLVIWIAAPAYKNLLFVSSNYHQYWGRPPIEIYRDLATWQKFLVDEHQGKKYDTLLSRNSAINPDHTENYCIRRPDQSTQWIIDRSFNIYDNQKLQLIAGVGMPVAEEQLFGEENIAVSHFIDAVILQFHKILTTGQILSGSIDPLLVTSISTLSKREKSVLENILLGLTATQMADKLFISKRTVEGHTNAIKDKLHCKSRSEIISKAIENNLINIMLPMSE